MKVTFIRPVRLTDVSDVQWERNIMPIFVTLARQASVGVVTDVIPAQPLRKLSPMNVFPWVFVRLMGPVGQFDPVQALMSKVVICVGGADVGGAGFGGADVGGAGVLGAGVVVQVEVEALEDRTVRLGP